MMGSLWVATSIAYEVATASRIIALFNTMLNVSTTLSLSKANAYQWTYKNVVNLTLCKVVISRVQGRR
jgi:hypothetical protein